MLIKAKRTDLILQGKYVGKTDRTDLLTLRAKNLFLVAISRFLIWFMESLSLVLGNILVRWSIWGILEVLCVLTAAKTAKLFFHAYDI